jgi:hypothetical protein
VWVDRQGRESPINAASHAYSVARLSPDGTRIAVDIHEQENGRELFYLDANGLLTGVPVQTSGTAFRSGSPVQILKTRYYPGFTGLGLDLRGCGGVAGGDWAGRRALSSSDQLTTTLMVVGAGARLPVSPSLIMRNRWPSGETS